VPVTSKPQFLVQRSCAPDPGATVQAHFASFVEIFFVQKIVHGTAWARKNGNCYRSRSFLKAFPLNLPCFVLLRKR
jgi:hypothetical protein